jgi:hypothetical protein
MTDEERKKAEEIIDSYPQSGGYLKSNTYLRMVVVEMMVAYAAQQKSEIKMPTEMTDYVSGKVLWDVYSTKPEWKEIIKTHENIFRMGVDAVLLRAGKLLSQFFNHKSDANRWLVADDDVELIDDFQEYCNSIYMSEWLRNQITEKK